MSEHRYYEGEIVVEFYGDSDIRIGDVACEGGYGSCPCLICTLERNDGRRVRVVVEVEDDPA